MKRKRKVAVTKEKLIIYLKNKFSTYRIAKLEHTCQTNVRYWIAKYGLKAAHPFYGGRLPKERFCGSCGADLNKTPLQINRRLKYCSANCINKAAIKRIDKKLSNAINFQKVGSDTRRKYLLRHLGNKCAMCKLTRWHGKPIPIIMDHIDGNPTNNKRENFRLLCPNCDAQLPTYTGRNRGHGRFYRRQRYKQGKSS